MMNEMGNVEIWKPIIGYEDLYTVSNHGRVASLERTYIRGNIEQYMPYKLKKISPDNYPLVILYKDGKPTVFRVHRLVAIAFLPLKEGKTHVNHIDANKKNNHYSNLEWVDRFENMQHAVKMDLMSNYTKVATIEKAIELLDAGKTKKEISIELNLRYKTLYHILRRNGR